MLTNKRTNKQTNKQTNQRTKNITSFAKEVIKLCRFYQVSTFLLDIKPNVVIRYS